MFTIWTRNFTIKNSKVIKRPKRPFTIWPYRAKALIQLGYSGASVVKTEVERIASNVGASRIIRLGVDGGGARLYR